MSSKALRTVGAAAVERVTGQEVGRTRALIASAVVGVATAAAAYRLLRSNTD
jgi:hypothetical protein